MTSPVLGSTARRKLALKSREFLVWELFAVAVSIVLALLITQRLGDAPEAPAGSANLILRVVVGFVCSLAEFVRFVSFGFWTIVNTAIQFLRRIPIVGSVLDAVFFVLSVSIKIFVSFVAELRKVGNLPVCDDECRQQENCDALQRAIDDLERNVKDTVGKK
jgi:hypothetical protein